MTSALRPRDLLLLAARRLGALRERVVFTGGATCGLLVTDPAAADPRATTDVDVIVEAASYVEYATTLRAQLCALGFEEDTREDAPICRFLHGELVLDVMPTFGGVLGFTNAWYAEAARCAETHRLTGDVSIRVVTAPHFVATKVEAFQGRGGGDFLTSRDIEDIVAVVDGRPELVGEVERAAPELRAYLAREIGAWLDEHDLAAILPGHLPGDEASQARAPIVLDRFERLTDRAQRRPR